MADEPSNVNNLIMEQLKLIRSDLKELRSDHGGQLNRLGERLDSLEGDVAEFRREFRSFTKEVASDVMVMQTKLDTKASSEEVTTLRRILFEYRV